MKMSFMMTTLSDIEIIVYSIVDVMMFCEFRGSEMT